MKQVLYRRDFLILAALSLGSFILKPWRHLFALPDFPQHKRRGRVVVGIIDLKAQPDEGSETIGVLYEDAIVPWLREAVRPRSYRVNQRWVETPDGFLWFPQVQPVWNRTNTPLETLPQTSLGSGMWVEVGVPYVDLILNNPPARSPQLQHCQTSGMLPRSFFTQIAWVDRIKTDADGQVRYRVNEQYCNGDVFWAIAQPFRPIMAEEMESISSEVEEKRLLVDITHQTISCYDGNIEVCFIRVSTGALYDYLDNRVHAWGMPLGKHRIWCKSISLSISGGSSAVGWDLPAVGWISLLVGAGVPVHSTYWHNDYGVPTSRGCVNATPDGSKWVFRRTLPEVANNPDDGTVVMPGGTLIEVIES